MTKILEEAIRRVSQLPERMQDHIGAAMLEEIDRGIAWDETLSGPKSLRLLSEWGAEALRDLDEARTEPVDPDSR